MTKVAILSEASESGAVAYRAVAGRRQSVGKTAGEALDALSAALPRDESGMLVVIQQFRPDSLFTAQQQERLKQLMARWRTARDGGPALPPLEESELNALIEAEVRGASERAAALLKKVEG